jgi:hypothetical protein
MAHLHSIGLPNLGPNMNTSPSTLHVSDEFKAAKPGRRCEGSIQPHLEDGVDWFQLAQKITQWRTLASTVMKRQTPRN